MSIVHKTFSVANIRLQTSADSIERKLSSLNGVFKVSVSISSGTMEIAYNTDLLSEKSITEAVKECGYIAYTQEIPVIRTERTVQETDLVRPLYIPLCACILMLLFHIMKAPLWIAWVQLIPAVIFTYDVLRNAA